MKRTTLVVLLAIAACGDDVQRAAEVHRTVAASPEPADAPTTTAAPDTPSGAATATHGDTILPMAKMIARFQSTVPAVAELDADAPRNLDELVARFAQAVADSSVTTLRRLTLDVSEFAYLYFPSSRFAREPYAQPPAVNWLLLEQNSLKGERRLLRDYGGGPLDVDGFRCDAVRPEGDNRIHEGCVLRVADTEIRLFGSVIERGGRFKLVSLANRL